MAKTRKRKEPPPVRSPRSKKGGGGGTPAKEPPALMPTRSNLREMAQRLEVQEKELAAERDALAAERDALRALALDLATKQAAIEAAPEHTPDPAADGGVAHAAGDGLLPRTSDENDKTSPAIARARPDQQFELWRTGNAPVGHFAHGDTAFFMARLADPQGVLAEAPPRLWLQYYHLESYPLIVLVAVPGLGHGAAHRTAIPLGADFTTAAAYWPLDVCAPEDQEVLTRLEQRFVAQLELFDMGGEPLQTWKLRAPLEANVTRALAEAQHVVSTAETALDFYRAVGAYAQLRDRRLGVRPHHLTADAFLNLPTPAAARIALHTVAFWAEEINFRYLVEVRSFPLSHWEGLVGRVLVAAVDFGLALPERLRDIAVARALAATPEDLFGLLVEHFTEVSLGLRPSDLTPQEDSENWGTLIKSCAALGVAVNPQVQELAAAAARRADPQSGANTAAAEHALAENLLETSPESVEGDAQEFTTGGTQVLSEACILEEAYEVDDDDIVEKL